MVRLLYTQSGGGLMGTLLFFFFFSFEAMIRIT